MHMSTSPFRKCDYCQSSANSDPLEPRLARRAWTVFHTTRKRACPQCWQKGHDEDMQLRVVLAKHFGLLRNRLLAEPPGHYGDPPLRKTHRIALRGISSEVDVCKVGDRFFGLDGTWDVGVQDRNVRVVLRFDLNDRRILNLDLRREVAGDQLRTQWLSIKQKHPDPLLIFRVGDEYHAFGNDARTLRDELSVRVAEFPTEAAPFNVQARFRIDELDEYLPALVKAGYRVAVCDKVEGPPVPGVVCEPAMQYRKPPSRAERYLENDRRMVLERLADLETVLRRHKALPDYDACENRWQKEAEDQRAAEALLLAHEAIALEMRLRNAELKGDSIQCNLGRTRCLFTAASLPALINEYRRVSRKAA
jgi:hypothetical protein